MDQLIYIKRISNQKQRMINNQQYQSICLPCDKFMRSFSVDENEGVIFEGYPFAGINMITCILTSINSVHWTELNIKFPYSSECNSLSINGFNETICLGLDYSVNRSPNSRKQSTPFASAFYLFSYDKWIARLMPCWIQYHPICVDAYSYHNFHCSCNS